MFDSQKLQIFVKLSGNVYYNNTSTCRQIPQNLNSVPFQLAFGKKYFNVFFSNRAATGLHDVLNKHCSV